MRQRAAQAKIPAAITGILALAFLATGCDDASEEAQNGVHDSGHSAENTEEVYGDADVSYVSGMIVHHEQAVEMSDVLLAQDNADPEVATLAEEIRETQAPEIEQMESWLEQWGHEPDESGHHGDPQAHAEHEGMMSEEELQELAEADGPEASRLFLEQMIIHHEGAISAAEEHLDTGENPQALQLSEDIIADQGEEIAVMEEMLEGL